MTGAPPVTAFLDASVLYPASIRNVLMYLALAELYRPLWSDAVHEEWIEALLRVRPDLSRARLERTRALMEVHVDDARVSGYEPLIDKLTLPDPDDRHVLAAAIHGGATMIVTANLQDFPNAALAPYDIEACHPDAFVRSLLETNVAQVVQALREDRLNLKRPPRTVAEYLTGLEKHGLTETVAALRAFEDVL